MIYLKQNDKIISFDCEKTKLSAYFQSLPNATKKEVDAFKLQEAKTAKLAQCKSYLSSTDWYAIRKADNGTTIPSEIETTRELARTLQDDINACTTIAEVEAININF